MLKHAPFLGYLPAAMRLLLPISSFVYSFLRLATIDACQHWTINTHLVSVLMHAVRRKRNTFLLTRYARILCVTSLIADLLSDQDFIICNTSITTKHDTLCLQFARPPADICPVSVPSTAVTIISLCCGPPFCEAR